MAAKAVKLADCAKISEQIMYICGLLHDVGHYTCDVKSHGKKSAEMAMDFYAGILIFLRWILKKLQRL